VLDLSRFTAVLFDMDGVLYRGHEPLPGVAALFDLLDARGVRYACVTNNATMTPAQFADKLARMDIRVPPSRIVTSPVATRHYLEGQTPRETPAYYIGMEGIRAALFDDGFLTYEERRPQIVVVGLDTEATYQKFRIATLAIRAGARFIGTNPDVSLPTEEGEVPGAGALLALLQAATGVSPFVIGKPGPLMFHTAIELLGAVPEQTLTIGDRLDTDIAGALAAGLASVLVLTGVTGPGDLAHSPVQPDAVFDDLDTLAAAWR
jgi:4-nitrophenyl phosphatase